MYEETIIALSKKWPQIRWRFFLWFFLTGTLAALSIRLGQYYKDDFVMNKKIVSDYPDSSQPYPVLCSIYRSMGKYDQAVLCYEKYLSNLKNQKYYRAQRPEYEVYTDIGQSYGNDTEKALASFNKAIMLNPDYAIAYAHRAKTFLLKGDKLAARKDIDKALALDPVRYEAYVYGVEIYRSMGDEKTAKILAAKAREIFPRGLKIY